jgi:hypothetical protein
VGHDPQVLHAQLEVPDSAREQVSRAIVEAGLGLLAMHEHSTGLEAVFLQLSSSAANGGSGIPTATAASAEANV